MSENVVSDLCSTLDAMAHAMASTRESLQTLREKQSFAEFQDGISLLSLKNHVLLSYLQSLVLLSPRRTLGHTLCSRSPPAKSFSATDRDARGNDAGDLVDSLVEGRIVLEKVSALEARMRYQIEKLVRLASEPEKSVNIANDPLAFKPNPSNLVNAERNHESHDMETSPGHDDNHERADDIYRPPRVAPVPYIETSKKAARKDRAPVPSALATLSSDPSRPHVETTSGLGGTPALASGRAAYLKRLKDFEEENFSRLIMKKSEARRRARDEEDLALGGDLGGGVGNARRRAGGLEDEFGDILKSVGRVAVGNGIGQGDGYEELRMKGKRAQVLARSRAGDQDSSHDDAAEGEGGRWKSRKRSRFEADVVKHKRKLKRRKTKN